ncbi:MAG TPA: zf-HC2 domain-containing protein [Pedococcus sp.]|jgi:anti-sigma factor RsiW|nr:zf-HC2 domain-containing protein [Pedococcus sp.]
MTVHDSYTEWDAAYVLGALSPTERREFEDHLATCAPCRTAVADFAGMPALLAQLHAGEVLAIDEPAEGLSAVGNPAAGKPATGNPADGKPADCKPAPNDGGVRLASVVAARRPAWHLPLAAAAAALVVGGMAGYAVSSATTPSAPPPAVAGTSGRANARLAFSAVVPSQMTAVVDVHATSATTEFRVECQYASPATPAAHSSGPDYGWVNYAIWVVDRTGRATQLREWTARPGVIMHPTGVTTVPYAALASLEIRRVDDGQTVMRALLT